MNKNETYLKVIDELLLLISNDDNSNLTQVHFRTITLLENLYGKNDIRVSTLLKYKEERFDPSPWHDTTIRNFKKLLVGVLSGIKSDVENNLIQNLEKQTIGSVVADFLELAKISAEEGNKNVAAVLASAALEDSLKRYAILNGMQVEEKDMSEVINSLKSVSLLKGPQASLLTSYTKTRNKAFHAEFDKIEMPEVKSLITFTEEFILKNLS